MSWMSALPAWQWVIMALIPPLIVMLYFLKLRRVPLEVPSTYLWDQDDRRFAREQYLAKAAK